MEPGVPARGEMSAVAADRFATAGDGGLQNFHFAGRAMEEMVEHSPSTVIVAVVVDRCHRRRRWRANGESVRRANGACPHTSHRPLRQSPTFRRKSGRGFSPVVNEEASLVPSCPPLDALASIPPALSEYGRRLFLVDIIKEKCDKHPISFRVAWTDGSVYD
jgi:hypothetical protein